MYKVLVSDIEKYLDGTYDWEENPDNIDFDFDESNINKIIFDGYFDVNNYSNSKCCWVNKEFEINNEPKLENIMLCFNEDDQKIFFCYTILDRIKLRLNDNYKNKYIDINMFSKKDSKKLLATASFKGKNIQYEGARRYYVDCTAFSATTDFIKIFIKKDSIPSPYEVLVEVTYYE